MLKSEEFKKRLKKKLTKELQSTNQLCDYKGQSHFAYKILQELVDENYAEKKKIGNITYWRKLEYDS